MAETYSTPDLWLGSLFLAEAEAELVRVQAGINGRNITFCFRGKGLTRLAEKYHSQEALANVTQIRDKINLLKDILFQEKEVSHATNS